MSEPEPLRVWRTRRAHGIASLAALAGVAKATIVNIEHGGAPRPQTIRRLSAALGVDPNQVTEFAAALDVLAKPRVVSSDDE